MHERFGGFSSAIVHHECKKKVGWAEAAGLSGVTPALKKLQSEREVAPLLGRINQDEAVYKRHRGDKQRTAEGRKFSQLTHVFERGREEFSHMRKSSPPPRTRPGEMRIPSSVDPHCSPGPLRRGIFATSGGDRALGLFFSRD